MTKVDPELLPVLQRVAEATGFRCDAYKESCLRRRLAVRMRATGAHDVAAYAAVLDEDRTELDRLVRALSVNVTSFYRNPETFDVIRSDVLPRLRERWPGPISCWSAGCASGEETYTIAMLLAESDLAVGSGPSRVWGTDINDQSLAVARKGVYPESSLSDLPQGLRTCFLGADGDRLTALDPLRDRVRFVHHDLVREGPPASELHLVLCRNVVIYFDRTTQADLFTRIADAMPVGGFLVLGKTETLLGHDVRSSFSLDDVRERVYERQ